VGSKFKSMGTNLIQVLISYDKRSSGNFSQLAYSFYINIYEIIAVIESEKW